MKKKDFEGWESPITEIMTDFVHKIEKNAENNLMCTIEQTLGYKVDKYELIKALNYDREQYNKGFEDAKRQYERSGVKCELLADGTLVVQTELYPKVKRVLVEYKTSGTLYYADNIERK